VSCFAHLHQIIAVLAAGISAKSLPCVALRSYFKKWGHRACGCFYCSCDPNEGSPQLFRK